MKNNLITTNRQSGNVIFMILIAIVLLASITIALKGDDDTTEDAVSDIKLEKQAEQLLTHMGVIKSKVVAMIDINGVAPSNVSGIKPGDVGFDTSPNVGKIYHPLGGGVEYTSSIAGVKRIVYNNALTITGIGTAAADIAMVVSLPSLKYCQVINKKLHGTTTVPEVDDKTGINMRIPAAATLDDATSCSTTGGCDNVAYQCIVSLSGREILYYHLLYAQ